MFPYGWMLFSATFQLCVAIAAQLVFMAPTGTRTRKLKKQVMKIRDRRMEVVNEVFSAMKL